MIVSATIPIHHLARERMDVWNDPLRGLEERMRARARTLEQWQQEWSRGSKGPWTRRLIPNIVPWVARKFGQMNYHLTQALTGHASFRTYTHKIGKVADESCVYCQEVDTPEHTLFQCNRWARCRDEMAIQLGVELRPDNMVEVMLRDEHCWRVVERGITRIMTRKERDKRAGI